MNLLDVFYFIRDICAGVAHLHAYNIVRKNENTKQS